MMRPDILLNTDALDHRAPRKSSIQQAAESTAKSFEALFVGEIFKSMRRTCDTQGDFGQQMYTQMFDEQLSEHIAESGIGLADVLAAELGGGNGELSKKNAKDLVADVDSLPVARAFTPGVLPGRSYDKSGQR